MSDKLSTKKDTSIRWWRYYIIPGVLLPPAVWLLVVFSRLPLSGIAQDTVSLPRRVSLPSVYDNCPIRNIQWHYSDSFTGVFVVVGDTTLDSVDSWVETLKIEGNAVTYGPIDSFTNVQVFVDNTKHLEPKCTGTIKASQSNEFIVGDDKIVIISRK